MVESSNNPAKTASRKSWFTCFAQATASAAGSPPAFMIAIGVVVVWALTGPIFRYSDVWQLVINTGTTIITFLMVFLVQNAQNRDGKVIQLKLDELIRAVEGAETAYVNMEDMSEAELEVLHRKYVRLAQRAARRTEEEREEDKEAKTAAKTPEKAA